VGETNCQFINTYKCWKQSGLSHIAARNKAIDEWRRYHDKELTVTTEYFETIDESCSGEDVIIFNQTVRTILSMLKSERTKKYFFLIIYQNNLEKYLNEELLKLFSDRINMDNLPEKLRVRDICRLLKYPIKKNGAPSGGYYLTVDKFRKSLEVLD
jgi:hypothetical protein